MIRVVEYVDANGRSPYTAWFSNVKGVGSGVFERRIGGGAKARQSEDISLAKGRWWDYRQRKLGE